MQVSTWAYLNTVSFGLKCLQRQSLASLAALDVVVVATQITQHPWSNR